MFTSGQCFRWFWCECTGLENGTPSLRPVFPFLSKEPGLGFPAGLPACDPAAAHPLNGWGGFLTGGGQRLSGDDGAELQTWQALTWPEGCRFCPAALLKRRNLGNATEDKLEFALGSVAPAPTCVTKDTVTNYLPNSRQKLQIF